MHYLTTRIGNLNVVRRVSYFSLDMCDLMCQESVVTKACLLLEP